MKTRRKKLIAITLLIVTLVLSLSSLSACGDEKSVCTNGLSYTVWAGKVFNYGNLSTGQSGLEMTVLNTEEVYLEISSVYTSLRKGNKELKSWTGKPYPAQYGNVMSDKNGKQEEINIYPSYTVTELNGEKRTGKYSLSMKQYDLYDFYIREPGKSSIIPIKLENCVGKHEITYTVPSIWYVGNEVETFQFTFNVVEDTRPDVFEIYVEDSTEKCTYTKYESVYNGRDLYVIESGDFGPTFGVRVKAEYSGTVEVEKDEVVASVRGLANADNFDSRVVQYINGGRIGSEINLVTVEMGGAWEAYKTPTYTCYVIVAKEGGNS